MVAVTAGAADRDGRIRLADGRVLAYREYGAPDGFPLVMLHGTPGSRLKFGATDAPAKALGLRIVAPDRWGYGDTSVHPRPGLAAFADDVAALADALGIERLAVAGVSGGGPYTAAVAAALGSRVAAAGFVSPVGRFAGTPEATDMVAFHRFCFAVLPRVPGLTRAIFAGFRRSVMAAPGLACRLTTLRAPTIDRDLMRDPEIGTRLLATFREGLKHGAHGPAIDLKIFSAPWDVETAHITAPARVWIGSDDRNVPIAAARALVRTLKRGELVELDGAGHLWVAANYPSVLQWIAAQAGAPRPKMP